MTTLVFGVLDIPYVKLPDGTTRGPPKPPRIGKNGQPAKAKAHKPSGAGVHTESGAQTTGDVATWLENKYHIMSIFYELHEKEIIDIIGRWYLAKHEAMFSGGPTPDPSTFIDEIATLFHWFIDTKQMDGTATAGVPTKASLKGVNHRMKNNRGTPGRPSFVDTGNYEDSFRAWLK